jgi:putative ABC transport system permease protein
VKIRDVVPVGSLGLRSKRMRAVLTSLGIAIGIGAMVAVVGISSSSRADVLAELDKLGTNLLQVSPGQNFFGDATTLPATAPAMIRRIPAVESAAATRTVATTVRRTDKIPQEETGGMAVVATEPELLPTLGAALRTGTFLNNATMKYPAVVLGSESAKRLGITSLVGQPLVNIGGHWFGVVGILKPVPLGPDIDRSVLIGYDVAKQLFGISDSPTTVRVRTDSHQVEAVRSVLAATASPVSPNDVSVTRPSDALAAKATTDKALTALLLGLGAVALLVGAVGIANVMVIAVLERRTEIGLRRALGATRWDVRMQFLVEAVLLSSLGGIAGVVLGGGITAAYATARHWTVSVPISTLGGAVALSLALGGIAGLYPAGRAARLAPAEAIHPA